MVVKKRRIPTYSLHMKRFLFMKEFGYQNIKPDFNATITNLDTFKNYFEEFLKEPIKEKLVYSPIMMFFYKIVLYPFFQFSF